MMKIITKHSIAAFALFAVAGTASAVTTPMYGDSIGGLPIVGSPNITSTGGDFKYKNGKLKYKANKRTGVAITLVGVPGLPDTVLDKAKVKIKDGTLTISGVDPFGTSGKKVTLVTADYTEGSGIFSEDYYANGDDLFGMAITGNADNGSLCPLWDFCTTNETVYIAGDFGSDFTNINLKRGANAVTTIPVPAAVWLFGSGLLGLIGIARRKKAGK